MTVQRQRPVASATEPDRTIAPNGFSRRRSLPMVGAVAVLVLAAKSTDLWLERDALIATAAAADAPAAQGSKAAGKAPASSPAETDAAPASRSEAILQDELSANQKGRATDGRGLEAKERLLEATEKRINAKLAELERREAEIKRLLNLQDDAQSKQFDSLVKVYETMKPKDAARIFERLDLSVQIAVATRMKEAKMAAVLSSMDSEAAKTLTMRLAQRAQTPG